MRKKFNDVGGCIETQHYMADISDKLIQLVTLVESGSYFTMNRPRQYGKTTLAWSLVKELAKLDTYLVIDLSFEGIGDSIFENEKQFCLTFLDLLVAEMTYQQRKDLQALLLRQKQTVVNLAQLSTSITQLCQQSKQQVVLIIDEIDKSSNNQLFLSFLGLLREKYLKQSRQKDVSFHAVILIGVHDIKSLKLKIAPNTTGKLNSPWNIAIDFKIDMSFQPQEIESMLLHYQKDRGIEMDTAAIAARIFYYTAGYPYLVSKLGKVADEELLPKQPTKEWNLQLIDDAFRYLVDEGYSTTLFDDLVKNLENRPALYQAVFDIVFNGRKLGFNVLNPILNLGVLYGILDNNKGYCKIHNRLLEQKIYAYMLSKESIRSSILSGVSTSRFFKGEKLDLKEVLLGFQQFMKENYSSEDTKFLEREGRLLFLSYLKPIINGQGFDFKEPNVAEERRMDVVVTYKKQREVIELKRWEGAAYHQKGLQQLSDYLDMYQLRQGYLLIFDFRKKKTYKMETIAFKGKSIFAFWV